MYNLIFRITFALAIIIQFSVFGQKQADIEQSFNEQKLLSAEKIYVHTDKPLYFVNDILWFKVYNLSNVKSGLSSLSRVVYVEIIDENNKPQVQAMINVNEGLADGSLQLPKQLETGVYKLRAYTNLMKNAGAESFFEKDLYIINPVRVFNTAKTKKQTYDISFFPEGGTMIEGISGNVAFKSQDNNGVGVPIRGVVIDDKNDTVATIKTFKFGIGKFSFLPQPERKYKAICIMPDKEILIKELPEIKKSGYTIALQHQERQLNIAIATNGNENNVYVVVHNGKSMIYAKASGLVNGRTAIVLDKSSLTGGLYHVTAFDTDGNAVAERIFFNKTKDQTHFKTDLAKTSYLKREKVDLKISATDGQAKLQAANASFAIYKIDSLQTGQDIDIVSDLYLRSELKGAIENPAYYFSSNSPEVNEALDNLLLTQGWRRFDTKKSGKQPTLRFLPEYNGHLIAGKVVSQDNNPAKGISLYLSSPKKEGAYYVTTTDSLGGFLFNTDKLFGKNEIIIQADYTKDSTSNISVASPYFEGYTSSKPNHTHQDLVAKKKYLEDYFFSSQVQDIYSKELSNNFYAPDSGQVFYAKASKSYLLANYTRFNTLEDVLREYVSEILVAKKKSGFTWKVVGGKELFEGNPLVLYDGIPYFDLNRMMAVYPDDIEKIEVLKDKFYYSGETYEGIISFYSKKATLSDYELNPKAIVIDYEGMQLQREFYAPKYDTIKNHLPDYRSLLHWEPNLLFNGKDKSSLSFYTSDVTGRYIGVIQGISADGFPGFNTFEIEVKK